VRARLHSLEQLIPFATAGELMDSLIEIAA
jgi:hypothetical protein